jgi:hypothetical protein
LWCSPEREGQQQTLISVSNGQMFRPVLRCWAQIRSSFNDEGISFPLTQDQKLMLELRSIIHPLRFIQTAGQTTKEVAVFQVYLLLVEAYFGVLDPNAALTLYDPGQVTNMVTTDVNSSTNPLDPLKPSITADTSELDPRTTRVRKMLKDAMEKRFYKRYHPRLAYKKKMPLMAVQQKGFHFSYLMDLQTLFQPALLDSCIMYRLIFSFGDVTREEKEQHYRILKDFLWKTIENLTSRVAAAIEEKSDVTANIEQESQEPTVPQTKKKGDGMIQLWPCWNHWYPPRKIQGLRQLSVQVQQQKKKLIITLTYPEINGQNLKRLLTKKRIFFKFS